DLRGANLREADLNVANLREADLREADLSGADLREADLRGADTSSANFWASLLVCADLSVTENLTLSQITSAYGDASTQLPERLSGKRPEHWPKEKLDVLEAEDKWKKWLADIQDKYS
ncbi:MAG: pentapeptide repeat-containing protein, partial [Rhodobacteraceae bacterium]|nr:pentapeptide repeat-containing protein [Paracoccaceae bacterium]